MSRLLGKCFKVNLGSLSMNRLATVSFGSIPVAHHFVCLLDAKRSVDEAWRLTLERFGDMAPTQNEVIGLLGQLNESNLLRVDLPPNAEPLLRRKRKRQLKFWGGQAMSILFIRVPLFNPDRLLRWLGPCSGHCSPKLA